MSGFDLLPIIHGHTRLAVLCPARPPAQVWCAPDVEPAMRARFPGSLLVIDEDMPAGSFRTVDIAPARA